MEQIIIFATVIAPIVVALVQLFKKLDIIPVKYAPLTALIIGLFVGFAASPFSDLELTLRLWGGGVAGLSAVGLFELGNRGFTFLRDKKEDDTDGSN